MSDTIITGAYDMHIHTGPDIMDRKLDFLEEAVPGLVPVIQELDRRGVFLVKGSIGEVAQRLGYQDPYYFSRIFRKVVGISPREYQNSEYFHYQE